MAQLNDSLRLLAKWRSVLIQNTVLKHEGTLVQQGPLAGLDFLEQSAEGCHAAKLLGTYEQPLHSFFAEAIVANYEVILNIGCAEGYYAVGLARKMPEVQVFAYDLNEVAQKTCHRLAKKNEVLDRVKVGGLFTHENFQEFNGRRVLLLCDIEGAELELLDLHKAPALKQMDILVEAHDCLIPGTSRILTERFADSHNITQVNDNGQRHLGHAPTWFNNLAHLDQLIATWEWRSGPTPWLVMRRKV